jgi:beta-N-acetylhexosaminidase
MSKSFLGRLMLDLDGTSLTQEENKLLLNPHVGGVILFARNISSRDQVQELCGEIRKINPKLLIAGRSRGGKGSAFKRRLYNFADYAKTICIFKFR